MLMFGECSTYFSPIFPNRVIANRCIWHSVFQSEKRRRHDIQCLKNAMFYSTANIYSFVVARSCSCCLVCCLKFVLLEIQMRIFSMSRIPMCLMWNEISNFQLESKLMYNLFKIEIEPKEEGGAKWMYVEKLPIPLRLQFKKCNLNLVFEWDRRSTCYTPIPIPIEDSCNIQPMPDS